MYGFFVDDGTPHDSGAIDRNSFARLQPADVADESPRAPDRAVLRDDNVHELRFADTRGALGNRVEHRTDVAGRARDDARDLADRGLAFQGFGRLARARLDLLEQPDVFDGNDGL